MTRLHCLLILALASSACSSDDAPGSDADSDVDGDSDSDSDADSDSDEDGDADSDEDGDADGNFGDSESPTDGGGEDEATSEVCGTTLIATVRDFGVEHPDFQTAEFNSRVATEGLVLNELGEDDNPQFSDATPARPQLTGPEEFAQWYSDVEGVNMPFRVEIPLVGDGSGKFIYDNQFFFPIDGRGLGDPTLIDANGDGHNFLFTTEIHTEFDYKGAEVFTFVGDDDLWLFINGKLAIDLGGLHPKLASTIELDELAGELGIEPGQRYSMDIFHAERHNDASTFRIETTIDCLIPPVL